MPAKNPSRQDILLGLAHFDRTELPLLRNEINSIGPSLNNARNCLERMHNIMTYVVRHCLQNALVAEANEAAQRAPSAEEQQATDAANTQAALAAAMAAPPGVAVPIPTSTPVGLAAPFSQPAAPPPTLRNVIVGRNDDATLGLDRLNAQGAPEPEPEVGDVPLVIIGHGGSRVIPPKGSSLAPRTFAPGQIVDATFVAPPAPAAPAPAPQAAEVKPVA
jgi:hypothetical protein